MGRMGLRVLMVLHNHVKRSLVQPERARGPKRGYWLQNAALSLMRAMRDIQYRMPSAPVALVDIAVGG